jgi:hypothetical protein
MIDRRHLSALFGQEQILLKRRSRYSCCLRRRMRSFTVTTVVGSLLNTSPFGGSIARDTAGNTYLCGARVISRLSPGGTLTGFAGTGLVGYSGDGGQATATELGVISSCVVDSNGGLLIAESGNHRIRRIDKSGVITTIVGTGVAGSLGDGDPGPMAQISDPNGLAIDKAGNLFFSNAGTGTIRELTAGGTVVHVAGQVSLGRLYGIWSPTIFESTENLR